MFSSFPIFEDMAGKKQHCFLGVYPPLGNKFRKQYSMVCPALRSLLENRIFSGVSTFAKLASRKTMFSHIHRGYYTAVRRYEYYLQVVKTIFHEWAQRMFFLLYSCKQYKNPVSDINFWSIMLKISFISTNYIILFELKNTCASF